MRNFNGVRNDDKQCDLETQKLNINHDTQLIITGFTKSYLKITLTYLFYIISLGWIRLFFHWYPQLKLYATHKKCPLNKATKLLIADDYQGKYKSYFVKDVRTISTANIRSNKYLKKHLNVDDTILKELEGKTLGINLENGTKRQVFEYKAFWFKKQCYIWDESREEFSQLIGLDKYITCSDLHFNFGKGLSKLDECLRRIVYGNNEIIVPVQSILVLLLLEVLNPFYIFQVFTLCVWFADHYYYYTAAIILMSVFGITSSILQTRRNQINLHGTVASTEMVRVKRENGELENINSSELVPGDVIELPRHQGLVVCDAVLITGYCIVNESMLTGESVPVSKTPLPSTSGFYDSKECSQHTIYSGTIIIQTKSSGENNSVLARVIRTGLQTNRGGLVAAILYPPPADFKFDQDSYKFIGILATIGLLGFIYTVVTKMSRGLTPGEIAIKALDIITIIIPPALPAAMTVGKLYAQTRLKKEQVYCINSRVINVSGSINCICFDKTGTLTEDGLDMWGVVPSRNGKLENAEKNIVKLKEHEIFKGMLVCHSLTLIDDELCGDPLDVKMFENTGWKFTEAKLSDLNKYDTIPTGIVKPTDSTSLLTENMNEISEIGIIQQYQFSSSLQRMSVIVRILGCDHLETYTKGSPEIILNLSNPKSIPPDILTVMEQYTQQGYRVIALGKTILMNSNIKNVEKIHRDEIEKNLEFLGLVILENRVKEPTIKVIQELKEANLHVLMITGDNIQTAVSVARECQILSPSETVIGVTIVPGDEKTFKKIYYNIQGGGRSIKPTPHEKHHITSLNSVEIADQNLLYKFALTGQTWELLRQFYPELIPKICVRGAVFARMTSDQKQQLVLELMQLGYYVAMCGDGANDCGALRAAHVGISLSEAESSVASPFTSRIPDITCVPKVIRQGRAALVTSFGIFKFMVLYSLTEFISAITLYSIDANLTDLQFLFIDICLIVNFAFFFGKTQAYRGKLAKKPPMTSLLSFTPLFSLIIQVLIIVSFQLAGFFGVQMFDWFIPFHRNSPTDFSSYENYSVFSISVFQYITAAIIFSRGKPYRRAIYTNNTFIISILILTIICIYIVTYPANWIIYLLKLKLPPDHIWPTIILVISFVNFLISFFFESFVINYIIDKKIKPKLHKPEKSKKMYLQVLHDLKRENNWPKIDDDLPILPITPSTENILKSCQVSGGIDNSAFVPDDFNETTHF